MQVLIAAAAVQVTFGIETWDLSYFSLIMVYPGQYQNPKTGNYHKGETNLGGFMCFSWKDFLAGNSDPEDKINLGLHEFAHALRFNGIKGNETDYFFEHYFSRWLACASKEFTRMQNQPGILRKYGAVNMNEFFSVVVETFFETPQEFKRNLPELFHHTSILLNQTIDSNGRIYVNCRKDLLNQTYAKLTGNFDDVLSFNLKLNPTIIAVAGFILAGIFAMLGEGYKYPVPYISFAIAALFWLRLEQNFTRVFFDGGMFNVEKGFFIIRGYKNLRLPISHFISITTRTESPEDDKISGMSVIYYYNNDFYEEEISADVQQPRFNQLCSELRKISVQVMTS